MDEEEEKQLKEMLQLETEDRRGMEGRRKSARTQSQSEQGVWVGCHVGRRLLIFSPSPSRQPLTPTKRGFSVPNDHMAEGGGGRGGREGGAEVAGLSDEAGEEGSVISETERKRMGRSYFIMHQIRKIHNLSLHPAPNATQLSLTPAKNTTASMERERKKRKVPKKPVRAPAAADGQN